MSTIWCVCVGTDYFSITEEDGISKSPYHGWIYGGDSEFFQSFETEKEAELAVIKLMIGRSEFATKSIESLRSAMRSDAWNDVNSIAPEADTNVIGCCDDDVFECHHYENGVFDDCISEPIEVTHWMPLPDAPT